MASPSSPGRSVPATAAAGSYRWVSCWLHRQVGRELEAESWTEWSRSGADGCGGSDRHGIWSFSGIPYAASPAGARPLAPAGATRAVGRRP